MMHSAAEKYNKAGLKVLPVKKDKSPLLPGRWNEGMNPDQFADAYGIGVICGQISGGVECLDFDNHQNDAKERLTEFMNQCELSGLTVIKTGGGGYHVLYRCEQTEGNQKLARVPIKENGKLRPDAVIETKGDNGYIVAAPTPGYKVLRGSMEDIKQITSQQRENLLELARSFNKWVEVRREQTEERGRPGDMYNESVDAIEDAKTALRNEGWTDIGRGMWRRPGKKEGVSATFGVVARNVFYCFTANGYPFEEGHGYLPFQVVGLLTHSGDFKKFAGELAERYTPEKTPPHTLLNKAKIDLSKQVMRPPVVMARLEWNKQKASYDNIRMFTLGNFSAIIGKAKSKKTIFLTMLAACVAGNAFPREIEIQLPEGKKKMVYFDTEQGDYDVYMTAKRIMAMSKSKGFDMYQLREFEPRQRCEMIEQYLKENPQVGFVVIDGVADLGVAINDEEEATRITSLLMRWTKQYNCHIVNVIHQNKMNEFATGHLGSYIMKKAEIIISVTKDAENKDKSKVSCDMSRAMDFEDFGIGIDDNGIPYFDSDYSGGYAPQEETEPEMPF